MKKHGFISVVAILLFVPAVCGARTIMVPGNFSSIQAAIDDANDYDEIEVAPGTYNEAINFNGKTVRLYSSGGPEVTTIDGSSAGSVVQCVNGEDVNTTLEGFTITGGNATNGGGMYCESSSPMVTNCIFIANTANYGGGIYSRDNSNPTVTNCVFRNNETGEFGIGGGMYNQSSSPTVTNCTFSNNIGGGMRNYYSSSPTVTNCTFSNNTFDGNGGGMYNQSSSPTLTNCNFTGNSSGINGGGMYNYQSSPTVTDCNFSGNNAVNGGGGMCNYSSSPTVTDCAFSGNTATNSGGGMFNNNNSNPMVTDCNFSGNSASNYYGGGMYNIGSSPKVTNCTFIGNKALSANYGEGAGMSNRDGSSPTVTDCNFIGNQAIRDGGGMHNYQSNSILTNCTFSDNSAIYGGGMYNYSNSSPTVSNCTFSGNMATNSGGGICNSTSSSPQMTDCNFSGNSASNGYGGGMNNYNNSTPTISNCTFSSNTATISGGGVCNSTSSSPQMTNCTFTGNTAGNYGGGMYNYQSRPTVTNCIFNQNEAEQASGGGIANYSGSHSIVTNCTFSGNYTGAAGGGIRNWDSSPIVKNCIIWDNEPDEISSAGTSVPTVQYCDVQGGYGGTGNINIDPLFFDAANGDLRLRDWSICADAGNSDAVPPDTTDLDGDGDTTEPTPFDLGGNPRFVNDANIPDAGSGTPPIVDIGAYERQSDSQPCPQPVYVYNWTREAAYARIQAAIDDANDGDQIEVAPMTFYEAINFTGKAIRLYSTDGPNNTTIDATGLNSSVVTCNRGEDANTILEGFTITVGRGTTVGNYKYGGGMYNLNSSPTVTNCNFTSNSVTGDGGGMYNNKSSPTVTNCSFAGNSAAFAGGGMDNRGGSNPTVADCTFSQNTASTNGGGMENFSSSDPNVTNCIFTGNSATTDGGGMYNYSSSPKVTDCTFTNNKSNWGGGIFSDYSGPIVNNCTFNYNTATTNGGGMYDKNSSSTMVSDCTFTGNKAQSSTYGGGGMFNHTSNPKVNNCTFNSNIAPHGGGMYNYSKSSPTMINCTFSNNTASWGGGMFNDTSRATITDCRFLDNFASDDTGAVMSYNGSLQLVNCIFSGNTAVDKAGAVYCVYSDTSTIVNCAFIGNSSNFGGGLFTYSGAKPTLINCTFSGNSAPNGGAVCNFYNCHAVVKNCIFWGDTPNEILNIDNCTATVTYSNVQGGWSGTGNINADPLFVNAAGGDLRLPPESPCIDAGNNNSVPPDTTDLDGNGDTSEQIPFDLRGNPRMWDGDGDGDDVVDMGAFEYGEIRVRNITQDKNYVIIQTAIDEAADGDEIEVDPGTYNEAIDFKGRAIRLYSTDGPKVTTIDANGIVEAYHVVRCVNDEDANTILEGFTITGGNANGTEPDNWGGGMYNLNSSPTIKNCTFTGNSAGYGGGMLNDGSSPIVTNCIFTGNTATGFGGGMENYNGSNPDVKDCTFSGNSASTNGGGMINNDNSSPTVTDCTFTNNTAEEYGGGMCNRLGSSPTVTDCTFRSNEARGNTTNMGGGGMYNLDNCNPTLTNCTFSGNWALWEGGGMRNSNSSPTITNCTFSNNTTPRDGGGMFNIAFSSPTLTNCILSNNTANWGGGMYNFQSNPTFTNCTFSGNEAGAGGHGGGMFNYQSSCPTVTNCILWGNIQEQIEDRDYPNSTTSVSYSDVQGGWVGAGNINADPLFLNAAEGDLRISSSTSPCVDTGDNNSVPADVTDLDADANTTEPIPWDLNGNPRFYDGDESGPNVVDMGALEFNGGPLRNLTRNSTYVTIQAAINDANDGDEIQAEPGTYNESIDFKGKTIRLRSTDPNDPNIIASTIIDGTGHYHVVQCVSGEDANTILQGFTITGGNAIGAEPDDRGGGMYNFQSSPTVTNCIFSDNNANFGGGMLNYENANPTVTDCNFGDNSADFGGGIYNHFSNPTVTNCTFSNNAGNLDGGCIHNFHSSPTVTNCTFSGNMAGDYGGGMANWYSSPAVTNCTLTGNSAYTGGGIYNYESSPTVTNCILWGDTPDEIYNDSGTTSVIYSDVEGGWPGTGNIAVNPRLVDPCNGDFRPRASECVDAGDSAAVPPGVTTDVRGKNRFVDDVNIPDTGSGTPPIVDMGACERQPDDRFRIITVDDDGPADFTSVQDAIDDAGYGDEIELAPGTYNETIDFKGKVIRLYSSGGPAVTIINGNGAYHAVQCVSGEGPGTILDGFTITGGIDSAMYNNSSSPTVNNCTFIGNSGDKGGGMYNWSNSSPTVTNCTFGGNDANSGGGMYNIEWSSPTVTNCTFIGNRARYEGGGMVNEEESSPAVTNCIFIGNRAAWSGGGIYNSQSAPALTNCTFSNNTAGEGGGIYNENSSPTLTNCILWGDKPDEIYDYETSSSAVSYSDVQGGWPGIGNINTDPLFSLSGEPHLPFGSPCIDAGTNRPEGGLLAGDPDGTWRVLDGDGDGTAMVDMGAYEFNPDPLSPPCMAVWPPALEFIAYGGQAPEPQLLEIRNVAGGTLNWLIDAECSWLELNRTGGQSSGETDNVILDPNTTGIEPGKYYCTLTIMDPNAINSPRIILVVLNVGCVRQVPDAYPTIQEAITKAGDGDIVLVADSIYYENDLDFGGRAIMVKSENGPQSCIIDCRDLGRGFYFHSGETHDSILDGFTIQDANTPERGAGICIEEAYPTIRNCDFNSCEAVLGGAIYVRGSTAILSNCDFRNNIAYSGSGMYNYISRPTVTNCAFSGNSAQDGAGMLNLDSSPTVTDCTFTGNRATKGGGMGNWHNSNPTVTNCTFSSNIADANGGGMYNYISSPTVTNCDFSGNIADIYGGGMYDNISSPTVANCTFTGNSAVYIGGGMYNYNWSSPALTNCTFSGNSAYNGGGMFNDFNSSPILYNCTFSRNTAFQGGGMYYFNSSPTVTNCILWGDTPDEIFPFYGTATVNYSDVEGGWTGTANINEPPSFVRDPYDGGDGWGTGDNDDFGDLRLQVTSPCIDIGRNTAGIYCDIRGSVRPIDVAPEGGTAVNNNFDMGAYEYSDYYSGTEDGNVPAFRDVEMPSFCLVGETAEIRWKNHPGFPDDDRRIYLPKEYQVNLVLVSEDRTRQITLNNEPITVPSTTVAPDIPYSHEYTFGQIHAGRWYLKIELSKDKNLYVESARTFLIGLREPKLFEIGRQITPPQDADLTVDPKIEEGREDYFFWSEYARRLYAIGPIAAVVEWTDTSGDPLPVFVGNVWPDEIQIHVADSPDVELLPAGSQFSFVEVRYADNDAAVSGSKFSATSEGRCVLMYGENANYEFVPQFEVVRTVLWNNPEYMEEAESPIGTEVTEPKHNEDCGSGHIYQEISPYDADIYDRDTRSGQIFAVNLDDPCSAADDLIIFWYQKGIYGADWPYLPKLYDPKWPSTPQEGLEKIVIASCLGSEVYGQNVLDATHRNIQIYNQPDPALPGCNPNEEHAAFFYSNQGYPYQAFYALRNDLNRTEWDDPNYNYTSEPYALLKYQDIYEIWHYRVFQVLLEESEYVLRYAAEVGWLMQPPYPLVTLLPGCDGASYADMPGPWWTDYNSKIWARHAGPTEMEAATGTIRWFYPLLEGFYYDFDQDGVQDNPVGTCVPWLDYHPSTFPGVPIAVTYDVNWPGDVPQLQVGETLMKPKRGLPEISNQCSVEIIYDEPNDVYGIAGAVKLIEPLSEHRVDLPSLPLDIKVRSKGGVEVFDDLPFHLRTRFYYDPLNHELVFKGYFDDTVVGEPILLLNVISDREKEVLRSLPGAESTFQDKVDELYELTQEALKQNQTRLGPGTKALSAGTAGGVGFVTLVFADDNDCNPLPVSVEVIKVVCGPYQGELKVIESDNVFDERITFRHSGDFGGRPEGRLFEWMYSYSLDKPSDPNLGLPKDNWKVWPVDPCDGNAVLDITVGGPGLIAVQDLWFSCRYYDETCGERSLWTEPQLHESWLKRVNRQVNLFDQRFKDFHETEINTLVSMIAQIGRRYEGDVALVADPENLNSIGMLELYETLFRRAAEFSIDQGINDPVANRTLLFASSRLATLHTLLGNEAYADALDPTIGFTTEGVDYGVMAPAIHCFQNQTDSLLSEELVLLRGLESDSYPQPLYNRLVWNFTSGDGEVAYASNYVITDMDDDGDIDEYDAKIMYPQGHGDAWGHYLMALKTYYRLLAHPDYTWVPQPEYVLVAGTPVEVDYFDERQFAKIAAVKAKAGAEIVDLTYRQRFDEDPENQWQGYKDIDSSRACGVAGWASRAGQGAYFDWVVANALLPDVDTEPNHTGLQKVDRTTVVEIRDIASSFNEVQARLDMADLGLNPLGIAKDAIPFDINPFELVDALGQPSGRTHFEQIYGRAFTALNNALTAFNFANQSTQLLRRQQDSLEDFIYNVEQRELDFKSRRIEIFGYPYSDDIGPTGTYPEGYDGPDIYHYMYVDPSELMSASSPDTIEFKVTFREPQVGPQGALSYDSRDVVFHLSPDGLGLIKPAGWTSSRRAPGELQMARSDLLQAKANFDRALLDYGNLLDQIEDQADILGAQYDLDTTELNILNKTHNTQESLNKVILAARGLELGFHAAGRRAVLVANALAEFLPKSVGFSTDVTAPGRGAIRLAGAVLNEIFTGVADIASIGELAAQQAKERVQSLSNIDLTTERQEFAELQQLQQLEQLVRTEASQRLGLFTLAETMQQASGRYLAALARGERIYEELTRFRKQTAADIQHYRYKDMTFRVFRHDALQKYRAQFDLAAMYAYLAAKAYDYETALLDDYSEAGQHFLNRIVRQRTIGQISQNVPIPGYGLAGVLAELNQNFDVFKTMMGFNNPQIETTWFSLRKENFRITQYAASNSDWQKELDKYYVDDLWDLPEFRRYCKPFDTEDVALPAIVIPFQTNITNGLNFFGWPGGADPFYAPENFVTKIRSVGIWFSNYDTSIMSPTPRVYLIPVGEDVVRADIGEIRSWQVVEQSIPLPFTIGEYELANNFEWIPMNDSVPGPLAEIRRYTRFRAYPDGGFNPTEMTYDSRLIGRSVWNTRWLLIIPGHSLYLSDPWEGMERFLYGVPIPGGDGERTGNGVTDIKLFFKTYAYPGY